MIYSEKKASILKGELPQYKITKLWSCGIEHQVMPSILALTLTLIREWSEVHENCNTSVEHFSGQDVRVFGYPMY